MTFFEGSSLGSTGTNEGQAASLIPDTVEYREAFEAEALPYVGDVYRVARHLVGDAFWANDLTQDVFLQAWKRFHRFKPGTNCRAWLLTILFHVFQHHRRRELRKNIVSWGPEHDELVACSPTGPSRLGDTRLTKALNSLPDWYRDVLILAEVCEYSYSEIAAVLNVPIGTVMSRLSRSKKQMRERMCAFGHQHRL